MSYLVAVTTALTLALIVSAVVTAVAHRLGRAREGEGQDTPLAPTRHVRLVRMGDPLN